MTAQGPGGWRARALLGAVWAAGGRGLGFVGFALAAGLLPLADWGIFAQARSVVLLAGPVLSLGLAATLMARLPQEDGPAAAGRLALGWGACLVVGGLAAAIWAAAGALAGAAAALPAYGALFFGAQAARALGRPGWAYAPLGVGTLAGLAAGLAAGPTTEAAAWGWAAGVWLAALAQAAALTARLARPRVAGAARLLREGGPLTASLLARGAVLQGPLAAAPLWLSAEEVGAAGLALLAAQPALMALSGISGALGPSLSAAEAPPATARAGEARAGADSRRAGRLAARRMAAAGVGAALALGLAGAAGTWIWAGPAAGLAALGFAGAAAAMALEAPAGLRLIARGRSKTETALQLLGAAAMAAAALVLIPLWGPAGVGAAAFAGAAARALACRPALRRGAGDARTPACTAPPSAPDGISPAPRGWAQTFAALRADHARLGRPRRRFALDLLTHKTFSAVASVRLERAARTARGRSRALIAPAALWRRRRTLALGCEIAWQAEIGPGLRLLHGFGVVVLPCARVGAGATLAHGATLGYRARPETPTWPESCAEVGDGAFVGPYALVWARLGPGAVLAPHAVLRDPAPGRWAVGGAPARPLRPIGGIEATALAAE